MGVVYKAEDTRLKRQVALKFLPPELTRDDDAKLRFMQEAQSASALDHPNICTIHEIDATADGQLFLAMAYYDGETLERGQLTVEEAVDIAVQVAKGLERAHESGIIHRDIKPANIMLTSRGDVKIVDFGLAKLMGQTGLTQTGTTLGTVAYMSPEQTRGADADARSDVWALGVMLYEMLTGQLPFRGEQQLVILSAIQNQRPTPVGQLRGDLPDALTTVVNRALQKDRDARYASAVELRAALATCQTTLRETVAPASASTAVWQLLRRPAVAIPAVLALAAVVYVGASYSARTADERWAREEAIPQIRELIDQDDYVAAFELAEQVETYIPADPALIEVWPQISITGSIASTPVGADVYIRPYSATGADWDHLGQTPITGVRLPSTFFRLRIQEDGYETLETFATPVGIGALDVMLAQQEAVPPGMVTVPARNLQLVLSGFNYQQRHSTSTYFMDKYEVTNQQFKEFVDAGGYERQEYWQHGFVKDGGPLSWDEAMAEFRDQTSRPGPSTWQGGTFADGHGDFPVTGVSWYEAAAYAEFAGKSLPTAYHWASAAGTPWAAGIAAMSNFAGEGPRSVSTSEGLNRFGTYDMAGNVKEWVWNEVEPGPWRYILGGGWDEPSYMFIFADARSPFDRSEMNGFRCVRYADDEPLVESVAAAIALPTRDYASEAPVSGEILKFTRLSTPTMTSRSNPRQKPSMTASSTGSGKRSISRRHMVASAWPSTSTCPITWSHPIKRSCFFLALVRSVLLLSKRLG